MSKQKTAVDILFEGLIRLGYLNKHKEFRTNAVNELIDNCKELEKQQIKDAYVTIGVKDNKFIEFKQYYNETFKQ